jgi:hypothetical protein
MMSSHLAFATLGHLAEVYHMFSFTLKKYTNTEMVFDPTYPSKTNPGLKETIGPMFMDIKEAVPPNAPCGTWKGSGTEMLCGCRSRRRPTTDDLALASSYI